MLYVFGNDMHFLVENWCGFALRRSCLYGIRGQVWSVNNRIDIVLDFEGADKMRREESKLVNRIVLKRWGNRRSLGRRLGGLRLKV
jgi:hypothetical protein